MHRKPQNDRTAKCSVVGSEEVSNPEHIITIIQEHEILPKMRYFLFKNSEVQVHSRREKITLGNQPLQNRRKCQILKITKIEENSKFDGL